MPRVADFIDNHRDQLIRRYAEEAGRLEAARGLSPHELIDTFPEYLSTLATISRQGHRGDTAKTLKRLEETHISLRLRCGYSQEDVVREYILVGRLLSSLWEQLPPEEQPSPADTELLFAELQDVMGHVVATFSGYTVEDRQAEKRTLRRLDAVAPESLVRHGHPCAMREALGPLVQLIQEALHADGAELLLADEAGANLEIAATTGACPPAPACPLTPMKGPSFLAHVATREEPVQLPDALITPWELRDEVRHSGLRSLLGLRLWPHGKLMGVLWVGIRQTRPFTPRALRYFETLVEYLSGIIDHALLVGALRERQETLSTVLEQLPAAVFIAEAPGGRLVFGNRAVAEMLRHPFHGSADVSSYGAYHGYHPDGRRYAPEEYPLARAIQRGEHVVGEEMIYERGDGTRAVLHVSAAPLRDEQGNIVSGVLTVADLTEQKRAEAEREQALALLDALVAAAPVGVALLDTELRYVRVNEALASINRAPLEAHLGRTVAEVLQDRAAQVESLLRQVLDTGQPLRNVEFTAVPAADPGVPHHYVADFFPVRTPEGPVRGVGGIIMDISERKRQEETRTQAAEFAEQLVGIVSHDLRTPLHVIHLSTTALLRSDELNERQTKAISRVVTSTERAHRMIHDLLDFTRARVGGGIPVTRKPLDLHALIRQVVEEAQLAHPDRELQVVKSGGGEGEWDEDRLVQVITNLVNNALAYSPPGTPVRVETRGEDGEVLLRVHNAGPPIPPELLSHLFEPMRRGPHAGDTASRSVGLGLFIVSSIVRAHGGTVSVESTAEKGTAFTVRLPRTGR